METSFIAVSSLINWLATNPIEALACATGLLGAFLLATRGHWAGLGWIAFLASNALWIYFARRQGHHGLLVQQLGFTLTTLTGIYVWLIKPRLEWDEWRGDLDGRVIMRTKHLVSWRGRRLDLHQIVAPDSPDCFHSHPTNALRVVLWNGYQEEVYLGRSDVIALRDLPAFTIGRVRPELSHRIHALPRGTSYSLWFRGVKTHQIQLRGKGWATK